MAAINDLVRNTARSEVAAGWSRLLTIVTPPIFLAMLTWGANSLIQNRLDIAAVATQVQEVSEDQAETKKNLDDLQADIESRSRSNRDRWDEIYQKVTESKVRIDGLTNALSELKADIKEGSAEINARLDTLIQRQITQGIGR